MAVPRGTRFHPETHRHPIYYSLHGNGRVLVVREDAVHDGGSKYMAVGVAVDDILKKQRYREFLLPASPYGSAQIVLAAVCQERSVAALIDYGSANSHLRSNPTPEMLLCRQKYGGEQFFGNVPDDRRQTAFAFRSGFAHETVITGIQYTATCVRDLFGVFDEVWVTVATGTTLRGLMRAGLGTTYHGVQVYPASRALQARFGDDVVWHEAQVGIEQKVDADETAPHNANPYYDGKNSTPVRESLRTGHALKRVLVWNVAGAADGHEEVYQVGRRPSHGQRTIKSSYPVTGTRVST